MGPTLQRRRRQRRRTLLYTPGLSVRRKGERELRVWPGSSQTDHVTQGVGAEGGWMGGSVRVRVLLSRPPAVLC